MSSDKTTGTAVGTASEGERLTFVAPHNLDVTTASMARGRLHAVVAAAGPRPVTVDLSGVERLDVVGLGVLMGAYRRSVAQGGGLRVLAPRPRVAGVLAATKLDRLLCADRATDEPGRWASSRL
jgi:anti-anti-sigma factor